MSIAPLFYFNLLLKIFLAHPDLNLAHSDIDLFSPKLNNTNQSIPKPTNNVNHRSLSLVNLFSLSDYWYSK